MNLTPNQQRILVSILRDNADRSRSYSGSLAAINAPEGAADYEEIANTFDALAKAIAEGHRFEGVA